MNPSNRRRSRAGLLLATAATALLAGAGPAQAAYSSGSTIYYLANYQTAVNVNAGTKTIGQCYNLPTVPGSAAYYDSRYVVNGASNRVTIYFASGCSTIAGSFNVAPNNQSFVTIPYSYPKSYKYS